MQVLIAILSWMFVAMLVSAPVAVLIGLALAVRAWRRARVSPIAMPRRAIQEATLPVRHPQRADASFVDTGFVFDTNTAPPKVAVFVDFARNALLAGDINDARVQYQKAAYGFDSLSPEQIDALRVEIAAFALRDPVYLRGVEVIRAFVSANPGVTQAELGRQTGENREVFNYIVYYAEANGALRRARTGRSYTLYLPGQPMAETKSKKARRKSAGDT